MPQAGTSSMVAHAGAPIQDRASFAGLRYANCWEDADILARALAPLDGARCLSVASGGDNSFSLLARGTAHVLAVDLSLAQIALVALKRAAFRGLDHDALVAFLGVRPARDRWAVYRTLRRQLEAHARAYWDAHPQQIEAGVIHVGRLETYFRAFRRFVLPLVHRRATVRALLTARPGQERQQFYREVWDSWRWRALCRAFFSRPVMGRLGRDPEFFRHAPGPMGTLVLERARHALTALSPEDNPYLRYILTGQFGEALPDYLRPERYQAVRENLDRLQLRQGPLEDVLGTLRARSVDVFNLSDVAEYMDLEAYHRLLVGIRRVAAPGARLAYWNLLAPRQRPASMGGWLEARDEEAARLHGEARTFFYRALVLEVAR